MFFVAFVRAYILFPLFSLLTFSSCREIMNLGEFAYDLNSTAEYISVV